MTKLYLKYEFDLDHDAWDHQNLVNANKYRNLLCDIFVELRLKGKHSDETITWSEVYDMMWQLAQEENINPWEEIF